MPFKIQRVPLGLQNILRTSGGETPRELEERIRGVLDLLQLYGLDQLQTAFGNSAAAAEGGGAGVSLSPNNWTVLFGASGTVVKTATMTALRCNVVLFRQNLSNGSLLASEALGPFGATETGLASVAARLPYPTVCPPGSSINATIPILGTDATANVSVFAEFGILG